MTYGHEHGKCFFCNGDLTLAQLRHRMTLCWPCIINTIDEHTKKTMDEWALCQCNTCIGRKHV